MTEQAAVPFSIRPATPDDFRPLCDLIDPFVAAQLLLPRTEDELHKLIQNGFVAETNGRIVGFAALEIYSKKMAELQCLAVNPEYQGRGIGKRLIASCIERARELKIFEVMAITATDDMFKACGFDYALPDQKRALFIHTGNVRAPK